MDDLKETTNLEAYSELLPPEGDPKLGYEVFKILADILKDRDDKNMPQTWNRYYELRRNKHWQMEPGNDQTVSLVSANLLGSHHSKTVNMLTDNNPTFDIAQVGEIPDELQDSLDTILRLADHWWRDQEQQSIFEESVHTGETYGVVAEKVLFEPEIDIFGEAETISIDPYYIGLYPVKCRKVQKAEAVLYFYPMTVREAQRKWPDHASEIRADEEIIKELGDLRNEVITGKQEPSRQGILTTMSSVFRNLVSSKETADENGNQLVVCECWFKDRTMIQDPETGEQRQKYYGFIRRVITCNGGEIVLDDRNNPSINPELPFEVAIQCYLWNKFPFSLTQSVTDPSSWCGMADFEQLEGLNTEFNKSLSQMTLYKDKAARLKFINPKDSGVENEELDDYPGIIRPSNSMMAQALKWVDPPQPPGDITQTLEIYKDIFFLIAGSFDLESAQTPGREVIAYKAIAALLENANRMLKGKIRNYSKMLRERGRMYISIAQNWYSNNRWITYSQDGENVPMMVQPDMIRVPAKLTVVSGSTMPKSKVQQREEAIELSKMGQIDQIALLQALDYPNWRDIVKRMKAGPLGMFLDALAAVGVPPELLQYFEMVATEEPDDIQKDVEKGELPIFGQVLQQLLSQGEPQQPEIPPTEQAEIEKTSAEVEKLQAEVDLIHEKQVTERIDQHVKLKGIDFDEQKLIIERARAATDIKAREADIGMKATQQLIDADSDERKDHLKAGELAVKSVQAEQSAKESKQGPYNEKGLKSNNKEV